MIMERSKNQGSLLAKGGYHQLPRCKLNNLKIKVFLNGSRIVKGEHPVIKEEPIQDSAPKLDDQSKDLPLPEAKETPKPLFLPKRLRISVADAEATDSSSDDENGCPREPPKKKFVKEICVCSPCSSGNDSASLCSKGEKKKYRGVRQRPWGSWVAEIRESKSRRRLWLGTYPTAEEAAMAYDRASIQLHGPNAQTNFLQVDPPKLGPD